MANRKVLINRHTSGNTAPVASTMYKGEIAVQHKTGEEILWTKNNDDVMVPFISCAQTIAIIDSKVQASEDVVKAKAGEAHLEVESAGTPDATEWILSTKDVQSEEEFKAYSAATKVRIDNNVSATTALTDAFYKLLNITVTGLSGDTIIVAEKDENGTGSNVYNLTHRAGHETEGLKKIKTDAYGHVVASSAVTTEDIQALGFKTSAETGEDLNALSASVVTNKTNIEALSGGTIHDIEALSGNVVEYVKVVSGNIETVINELSANTTAGDAAVFASAKTYTDEVINALDSSKVATDNRHYITAITIEDGKLSTIGEAEIPVLASAVTGTGNVVTDIAVSDHTITYNRDLKAASDADLEAVSGIVDTFSAATVAEFDSAFTAIQAMDKAAAAVAGQVVTTVAQEDGKVTETKANVKDLQLGGYVKDTTATGDIESADTINAALSKLENKAAAITIANADGSINVTAGATGTDINVNIKSGEKVLAKDGNAGLYTDLDLVKITTGLPETVKERYQLLATDDSQIGVNIDVPKDSHIVSINYITTGEHAQNLEYVYIDASGQTQTTYVDMSELVLEAEFASGVTVTDHIAHGVVDPTSETFLTVGGDGFKLSGVQDAIDAKVNALDVTGDTAAAGQYVAAIQQTDGLVSVKTRANVSEAVLNNYAKGLDSSAVAATDTINEAVSKLENQIDAAKAAATTKVVEGTDAGNNMTITPATSTTDSSVTYTIDLVDVASASALTAEIAARKAVDGQNGDTYAANTGTTYITGATSLNDADVKLDTAIKSVADQVSALDYTGLTNENTKVVTDVKQENGLVSASATTVGDLVITAITTADTKVAANDNLATIAGKLQGQIDAMDSSTAVTAGKYITGIAIADGKISGITEESLPANVPISATTAAPVDTPSAVLTGVTATGTDNHELTFGMSNKVFSATTADSAVTSQSAITSLSAQTSVSANMAYEVSSAATITSGQVRDFVEGVQNIKVNSAYTAESADTAAQVAQSLTMTDGTHTQAYNGSAGKSLTFGTATSIENENSMTMSDSGVVDVNIIDCGEY